MISQRISADDVKGDCSPPTIRTLRGQAQSEWVAVDLSFERVTVIWGHQIEDVGAWSHEMRKSG
jgi:hypothetical protein